MNVITKLMYSIHRILGTLLCILFLMWFLSAFVMMYHRFPRVSAKEKMQKLDMLSQTGDSLPDISSVTARLPRGVKVRSTILNLNAGHPEFSFSTTKGTLHFLADSTISRPSLDSEHLHRTAALWCSSPITRIDTLHSLDQWIPFAELKKEMLEKEGFTVSAQLEGLGQIPEIQEIFIDHIRFGLKHRMLDIMTKKAAYAAGKDTE